MDEAILRLEGVTKYYALRKKLIKYNNKSLDTALGIKAVDKVYLELNSGEIFGLLGPNGAGKSTILKLVCGLISASEGKITLNGNPVSIAANDTRKDIGALIEMPIFIEKLSGEYNLKYLASLSGDVTIGRINELVELFDMQTYIGYPVSTYSLGMRQKLGIVQAIMNKPKLLILDEPTNGLDPKWVAEVRELLKRLAKEYNMTILISSHILSEMQELCDRVAIMSGGKILSIGNVKEMMNALDDGKETVEIKVDDIAKAVQIVKDYGLEVIVSGDILLVKATREQLPLLTKELVMNNIMLGGVNVKQRKLEDIFRRVTEQSNTELAESQNILGHEGGAMHE